MTTSQRLAMGLILLTTLALSVGGCTPGMKRSLAGEQSKRAVYLSLMTPEQAETLKAMEKAEIDEQKRILYVQEIGVYDHWAATPAEVQQHILKRRVVEGMKQIEVQMAWGQPAETMILTSDEERQEGHERLAWLYQPKQDGDAVTYRRHVIFVDNRAAEIVK